MKEKKNILGAVSSVAVIMVLSRLLSLVGNQVYMSHYGADNLYLNIYSYAINVPNIIFTSIGTALSTVVIPIYVGHRAIGEEKEAKSFADNIISISLILTSVLVVLGLGLSFVLPKFTGYAETKETYDFAVMALMTVMPVMFFYALNYIFQGMLQAVGRYKLPAFVSVPSSLVVIFYTLFLGDKWGVKGLLIATVIGLSLQAIILIPPLIKEGYRYTPKVKFNHPDIIKAAKMTVPVLLGVGAYQINMLYNNTMVADIDPTAVTLFVFVQNITIQLVLAFVYSVTAVIYPRLTESVSRGNMGEYKDSLSGILMSVSTLLIPMTFGFISVRETLLNLISAWGKISPDDISKGAMLICAYAIGLLGIGFKEILDRAFYSLGNTKISAVNGVVIMSVNIVLSLVFIQSDKIGVYGIPLAYSLACLVGCGVLLVSMRKKVGVFAKGLGVTILKSIIASLVMLCVVEGLNFVIPETGDFIMRAVRLFVPVGAGLVVYYIMAVILKIKPVTQFTAKILKRGKQ
ncbi:MAG: murein biosynthesis integral membrane protein MurJ [Clostridia bacterium]|nr:murein biosynthesis integral membrane protein MurJ [Clostridia bacterium]